MTRDGCFLRRSAAEVSQPNQHGGCYQLWVWKGNKKQRGRNRGRGRRQNDPLAGCGLKRKAGNKKQMCSDWDTTTDPTNWIVLWLKIRTTQWRLSTTWSHLLLAEDYGYLIRRMHSDRCFTRWYWSNRETKNHTNSVSKV